MSTRELKEGNPIGCCITRDGDLEIYINGQKRAVGWRNVPTDKPLWGVVDIAADDALTIQSEFYCGKLYSESLRLHSVSSILYYAQFHTDTRMQALMHTCTHAQMLTCTPHVTQVLKYA